MKKLSVLVGCEWSGRVRDAFAALGHDAWSCDLLPSAAPGKHWQGDVLKMIGSRKWDLGIFHPPCTYLTLSAEWAYGNGPYHQKVKPETLVGAARRRARAEAVLFFRTLLEADIPHIAVENPIGCISTWIRKPDQIIQPYQFGDDASKSTCLWLRDLPWLVPTEKIHPRRVCKCRQVYHREFHCPKCGASPSHSKPRWANQTDSGQNILGPSENRGQLRGITYRGIAAAMAAQYSAHILRCKSARI